MYGYGKTSRERLDSCDPKIMRVFYEAGKGRNISIIHGYRSEAEQYELFKKGREFKNGRWVVVDERKVVTDKDGINKRSKHNYYPSRAVDAAIYHPEKPHIHWNDIEEFKKLNEYIQGVASQLGIRLRWGGEWGDYDHWELM